MRHPFSRSVLLVVAILGLVATVVHRLPAGENYAFLVGVANYDKKELKPLQFTRSDILDLHQVLVDAGYKKANIVLMHDDLKQLDNRRYFPEAAKIRDELKLLLAGLEKDDSLIVAFSGHGVQFKGQKRNYFCPVDAKLDEVETLIALSDIYSTLEQCPARQKLLLVDACRDDPQSQLGKSRQSVDLESVTRPQTEAVPEGLVALFSCGAGQRSFEDPDLKHGVFFYHVLEGLKGAARNADDEITLDNLVAYARKNTQTFARTSLAAVQTPQQLGDFTGTWVLRSLKASDAPNVREDPGNLMGVRGQVGASFLVRTTGRTDKAVYGTDVYSDDSNLGTAAVHAGLLGDGERGVVKVTILGGRASFQGTSRGGVTTYDYGSWDGSFRLDPIAGNVAKRQSEAILTEDEWLRLRGREVGQTLLVRTKGSRVGALWGTAYYTSDSSLGAAAVHAGVLRDEQEGVVRITLVEGMDTYRGTTRNGVSSDSWTAYPSSYRIESDASVPLSSLRGHVGKSFLRQITGRTTGFCWGTDIYSDDSDLATAAVHAGVLRDGESGAVKVTILGPQKQFQSSTRNGVASSPFDAWLGSFKVETGAARGARALPVNFNGMWSSRWGDVKLSHPPTDGKKPFEVQGTYGYGSIRGIVDPKTRTMTGSFDDRTARGKIRLVLASDNQKITGSYGYERATQSDPIDAYEWNMTRKQAP